MPQDKRPVLQAKPTHPTLLVLAGINGAGKSSVAGASLRASGLDYYNPDVATDRLRDSGVSPGDANAAAWLQGRRALEAAIIHGTPFAFETTLGGNTMPMLIAKAAATHDVVLWFVGLDSAERHLARVAARVAAGGHDIPARKILERWDSARRNLIALMPHLHELHLYDNSVEQTRADDAEPTLLLHLRDGRIIAPDQAALRLTPDWAKAIVEAAQRLPDELSGHHQIL